MAKKKTIVSGGSALDRQKHLSHTGTTDLGRDKRKGTKITGVMGDPKFQRQIEWYFHQVLESKNSERISRYNELTHMVQNDSLCALAVTTLADEAVQLGMSDKTLEIYSENKNFAKDYMQKFSLWRIENYLRPWCKDLAQYGDFISVLEVDNKGNKGEGVKEIYPRSPYSLKSRLEFTLADAKTEIGNQYAKTRAVTNLLSTIDQLTKTVNDDIALNYKPFLLGFHIDDFILPPWNVIHGRIFVTDKDYTPYGKAMIDDARVPYRTLLTTKMLMTLARLNSFPTELIGIKTGEKASEDEKWDIVNEAREEITLQLNSKGVSQTEIPSVNNRLFYPSDLLEFDIRESRIDVDAIADAEFFRDDMIMGLKVPKGYLIVDEGDYDDGEVLVHQDVKFARSVYIVQRGCLEQVNRIIEIDMASTGKYTVGEVEYVTSMPYPVPRVTSDRLALKSDAISLINDMIDLFKDTLEVEEIPKDLALDLLTNFAGFDPLEVQKWFDLSFDKNGDKESTKIDEDDDEETKQNKEKRKKEKLLEFYENTKSKNVPMVMREAIHKTYSKNRINDYVIEGRHWHAYHIPIKNSKKSNVLSEEQRKILRKQLRKGINAKLTIRAEKEIEKKKRLERGGVETEDRILPTPTFFRTEDSV